MASIVASNADTITHLRLQLKQVLKIINEYRWIIEAYISDFFVRQYWDSLPGPWQEYLEKIEFPQLSCLLTGEPWCNSGVFHRVCPLSLLALKVCVHTYSLNRHCVDLESPCVWSALAFALGGHSSDATLSDDRSPLSGPTGSSVLMNMCMERTPQFKNGQLMEMKHMFRRHVKPKKQHEIQNLSKVINWVCGQTNSQHVVDVGAGLGHLSRLLTFGYGLKVTTLEASDGLGSKASKLDWEIEKDIQKKAKRSDKNSSCKKGINSCDLPRHLSCTIQSNISTQEFLDLINNCDVELLLNSESRFSQALNQDLKSGVLRDHSQKDRCQRGCNDVVDLLQPFQFTTDSCLNNSEITVSQVLCESPLEAESVGQELSAESGSSVDGMACPDNQLKEISHSAMGGHIIKLSEPEAEHCSSDIETETREKTHVQRCDRLVLAGLHACGDLTAVLLRVFAGCSGVVGLASVACCYMKLSCQSKETQLQVEHGYPLSRYLQGLTDFSLTYAARELACHFADMYAQRLLDNHPHLKIHAYRAAVQRVIKQVKPDFKPGDVRLLVRNGTELSFLQYASQCFQKLGLDMTELSQDLLLKGESLTAQWRRVVAFYTVRLSLAPLLETAILIDRMLFLYEHGIPSVLVPIFNSGLSPRNFVLLALKQADSIGKSCKGENGHEKIDSLIKLLEASGILHKQPTA